MVLIPSFSPKNLFFFYPTASLDGQNSFCQNLVHWVTGCSFKKIRRVRDHLKKDPKSLPEHGLKKYWKVRHTKNQRVMYSGTRRVTLRYVPSRIDLALKF